MKDCQNKSFFACIWQKLSGAPEERHAPVNHDVAPKQVINPNSPAKEQQRDFIDEGGNSQPLKKP